MNIGQDVSKEANNLGWAMQWHFVICVLGSFSIDKLLAFVGVETVSWWIYVIWLLMSAWGTGRLLFFSKKYIKGELIASAEYNILLPIFFQFMLAVASIFFGLMKLLELMDTTSSFIVALALAILVGALHARRFMSDLKKMRS
jgi:hypothetical protein